MYRLFAIQPLYNGYVSITRVSRFKSNKNVVYRCFYHVVWCTKYRRDVITPDVEVKLKEIIREVCEEKGADLEEIEIMPDHVHLLVQVDPQYGVHRLIKTIKGRSSRLLRQQFAHITSRLPSLWTNSYFVSTVGGAPLATVKQYIANQKHV